MLGCDNYTNCVRASVHVFGEKEISRGEHTSRDNDDHQQDYDGNDHAYAHLDVLPPHLLPHTVGSSAEALGRYSQVVGLVLERIETLSTLRNLVDVLPHHPDGVIDLLWTIKSAQVPQLKHVTPSHRINIQLPASIGEVDAQGQFMPWTANPIHSQPLGGCATPPS